MKADLTEEFAKLAPWVFQFRIDGADYGGEISAVGDWTKIIVEAAGPKPVWMTLQISFSGTATKGKTLRMPTFPEERFMTYQAIINGARGLNLAIARIAPSRVLVSGSKRCAISFGMIGLNASALSLRCDPAM